MGQLVGKRDEFWETAPSYEGKKEIWDALRAAATAAEANDFVLAQAILDGAGIYIPSGMFIITLNTKVEMLTSPFNVYTVFYKSQEVYKMHTMSWVTATKCQFTVFPVQATCWLKILMETSQKNLFVSNL